MNQANRRRLLKMLGGAPMLPIGGVSMAALLAGCNSSDDDDDATVTPPDTGTQPPATPVTFTSASFTSMPAPTLANPELMARTTVSSAMNLAFSDGSKRTVELGYEPFFITGDNVPDGKGGVAIAGGYFNLAGAPIMDNSVPAKARQFFSNCPDGTSLLALSAPTTVPGVAGNAVYAVVQFEYQSVDQAGNDMYGLLPSPIAVLTLSQDPNTGKLSLVKYSNVDTSSVHGLWITCGASLSPWGTHLSSEEYEPDATTAVGSASFQAYSNNVYGDPNKANPYHYGHMPEVTVHPDGTGTIKKHYCMGRISHELVQVMPDERTALMGDDATNGGLFMFVADRKADLSAGTLYVAKWTQTSGTGPGAGTLTWIKLATPPAPRSRNWPTNLPPPTSWTCARPTPVMRPSRRFATAARTTGSSCNRVAARPRPFWKRTAMRRWWVARWPSPRWKAPPSTSRTRLRTARCRGLKRP